MLFNLHHLILMVDPSQSLYKACISFTTHDCLSCNFMKNKNWLKRMFSCFLYHKYLVMTSTQKNLSTSTAIYLASHSADFTILNTSGQSPLDLCSDPSLIKLLKKAQQAQQDGVNNATDLLQPEMTNICLTCSSRQHDTLFSPCGHVASCNECVQIQDKPVVCKRCGMEVKEHTKVTFMIQSNLLL